jgi:Zn-dependent M16 (insulinase) family peptidase
VFKGVVFNEMKGYFANSESLFETEMIRRLYPSHTYSHVFGGHPLHIVDLKVHTYSMCVCVFVYQSI